MSEAKECVGGRIVQMMHDPPSARSALRTLMSPHDARAATHTLCHGRRPPAHGSHCYRPEAAAGILCGRAQAEGRLRAPTLCMTRPEAAGMLCGQGPGRRPATISHTDGRRPQARLRMMHARSASDFGAGPASCGARGFLYTPAIVFSVVFLCFVLPSKRPTS